MKTSDIKTIDVNALEWLDRINGNSYLAAIVTLNFGLQDETRVNVPFTYGYGDHYITEARNALKNEGLIPNEYHSLREFCKENNIILRNSITRNCKKRDLINLTK
jgi:hypothetical protein